MTKCLRTIKSYNYPKIFLDPGTIWHYFRPDQNDGSAAICGICNELIHYFYNENDKGSLRLHFMRVHKGRFVQMNQIQDDWFSSDSTRKRKIIKYNKNFILSFFLFDLAAKKIVMIEQF